MTILTFPRPVETNPNRRSVPIEFSRYTANASSAREDLDRLIRMDSASPLTVTLNANGTEGAGNFYVGDTLFFIQWGDGAVTFAAGANASLRSFDSLVQIEGKNAIVAATYCEGNEWLLSGRLA